MKRKAAHLGFALAAGTCALACAWQGWQLQSALRLNADIVAAPARPPLVSGDAPPVRLASAIASARAGNDDAALKLYAGLLHDLPPADAVSRAALFNLGNLYLRQGLASEHGDHGPALPMLELAKQRYRDLLRIDPEDWDARYNLDRALWLAPEEAESYAEANNAPAEKRRVVLRGMAGGDLP